MLSSKRKNIQYGLKIIIYKKKTKINKLNNLLLIKLRSYLLKDFNSVISRALYFPSYFI